PDRVFSESIANTIKKFMIYTVDSGTGTPAKPTYGGAGGKTATAETGWIQNGKTINQAWFAGFYPAESPRYAIVAMLENGVAGGADAGPVFKYIADSLAPSLGYSAPSSSSDSDQTRTKKAAGE
ncbi:MAG TPA: penicillin-binding transpeptidase domain-containing protein, partial [Clostridia bacterium]|nr:penicillin-binding transpeptidase domain-containing protein [Clostridia bacterium]